MISSMTGFGRAEYQDSDKKISVEIRSVNHRYLECNIRTPRMLHAFESDFRSIVKEYATRGKVDVFIAYEDERDADSSVHVNTLLAEQYLRYGALLEETYGVTNDLTASRLLTMPDVLRTEAFDPDADALRKEVEGVLRTAAEQFRDSRRAEGAHLQKDLLAKLEQMEVDVAKVEAQEPEILEAYRNKLREKVQDLLQEGQIEESRLAAEVVLYADKISTDEETVRLRSHIRQLREDLSSGEGLGRKMDFLVQEMNREANTILSKAGNLATSDLGVALKTVIEKIREQVQNIE